MKYLFNTIRFLWELPQNIFGIVIYLFVRNRIISVQVISGRFLFENYNFGISLGSFIFWMPSLNDIPLEIPTNLKHEFGHSIQSKYFGPLYLIIIGIPSITRVVYSYIFFSFQKKEWTKYYNGYPEKWADSLGLKHYK